MDSIDKIFVVLVYACAIGIPFCIIGAICEYLEKRGKNDASVK